MSHNYATRSKRMKLTLEEDIKGEKIIDNQGCTGQLI